MKIVKYKGGLGNQMFQYAFSRLLQETYSEEVLADFSYYENYIDPSRIRIARILQMNIKLQVASKIQLNKTCILEHKANSMKKKYKTGIFLECVLNRKYYFERNRAWRAPEKILNYTYLDGYWQSWKYLRGMENKLKEEFTFQAHMGEKSREMIAFCNNTNSVMVGIRRGDYTLKQAHYGKFEQEYYDKCMQYISDRIENPVFIVFSNDIEWVKDNVDFKDYHMIFRTEENQDSDIEELFVMSACKHNIISNSTYQWWGAWLNPNTDKIAIAPKQWFADQKPIDIVPDDWIKM